MTRDTFAADADQHHPFSEMLRIREAAPAAADSARLAEGNPNTEKLRAAFEGLRKSLHSSWRWLEQKRTQQLSSRRLRVAETISLGEKRSVSIVQVDGAQYLIGSSTGSVQLLAVLDTQDSGGRAAKFEGRS